MIDAYRNFIKRLTLLLIIFLWSFAIPAEAQQAVVRVALFEGKGASAPAKRNFERVLGNGKDINYQIVYGEDLRDGSLKDFDALVVPGGSADRETLSMGPEARNEVRRFVREGGIYLGVCAGAYLSSEERDDYLDLLPLKTLDQKHWFRTEDGTPVDVELTRVGMDVFGLDNPNVKIVYENGPIFAPPLQQTDPSFAPLGFFRSEVVAQGGQRGVMLGAPAAILSRYGKGIVLAISPHPEKTPGLGHIINHALRWLYAHRAATTTPTTTKPVAPTARTTQTIADPFDPKRLNVAQSSATEQLPQDTNDSSSSPLGQQALQLAESIFNRATVVRYVHHEVPAGKQIDVEPDGSVIARTDCSGFISYVVHEIAPRHYHVIREREPDWSYPQAKIWARYFNTLEPGQPQDGWLRINNWRNLEPGDIIAWQESNPNASNTGHVMMIVSPPSQVQEINGYRFIEVPVIDSSTTYHFAPERLPPRADQQHRNGLGMGCVRIMLSNDDRPIGYWAGTYWGEGNRPIKGPAQCNMIRFARMVPLEDSG